MTRNQYSLPIHAGCCEPVRAQGMTALRELHVTSDTDLARYMPRWHHLVLCLQGAAQLRSPSLQRMLTPDGEAFLVPARSDFRITAPRATQLLIVYLDPDILPMDDQVLGWPRHCRAELEYALRGLLLMPVDADDEAARWRAWAELAARALEHGLRSLHVLRDPQRSNSLQQLLACLDDSLEQDWQLRDMAERMRCSVTQLGRCFAAAGLQSPMRELRERRLQRARMYLRQSSLPLQTIAERVGFASAYALSRAFSRRFRQSPRSFRQDQPTGPGNGDSMRPPG
ncbi:MAG: helix-turn-helix transcriptional regulator [Planctomycetota bacterium]